MLSDIDHAAGQTSDPHWLHGDAVATLLAGGRINRPDACTDQVARELGLLSSAGELRLPDAFARVDVALCQRGLTALAGKQWPHFQCEPALASTNSSLMDLGTDAAGRVLLTEYQHGGRGRRGNRWYSPVGRNLCVSVGWGFSGPMTGLMGLSLVVGLAVADALYTLDVPGVRLKWPNDLIVPGRDAQYAKLGGILVELQSHSEQCVAVIGIGLNHGGAASTRRAVDVLLADVAELKPDLARTELLTVLINSLADYLGQFATSGFAPMIDAWNTMHAFHGKNVFVGPKLAAESISGAQPAGVTGRVAGVSEFGQLLLDVGEGPLRELDAGEVSLRSAGDGASQRANKPENG